MFPDLMRDDVFRLETERLWLRWPRAADAARIADLASDREVAAMTANLPHPYPPGAAAEFILTTRAANLAGTQIVLGLALKRRPNEIVGVVGLRQSGVRKASAGYWLGKPWWGQGLTSEALCALVDLAMKTADIDVITAETRVDNPASAGVLEKVGFRRIGSGVTAAPARGGALSVDRHELTRADWRGCWSAAETAREFAAAG